MKQDGRRHTYSIVVKKKKKTKMHEISMLPLVARVGSPEFLFISINL